MKSFIYAILITITLFYLTTSAPSADKVTSLPDYDYTASDIYSGYLNVASSTGKKLHYLLQQSENDAANDPLVLWLNGGPGCSSMLGWGDEHGPMVFKTEAEGFVKNDYSWNKKANVLYIESPAGVGYSIAETDNDAASDDIRSSFDNLSALLDFFSKFPEYKKNQLTISGESYAGIYLPYLATRILDYNLTVAKEEDKINLVSMMIGNGVSDWKIDTDPAFKDFAYNNGLYSYSTRQKYLQDCKNEYDEEKCGVARKEINDSLAGINIYDVYRTCYVRKEAEYQRIFMSNSNSNNMTKINRFPYTPWLNEYYTDDSSFKLTPPCTDDFGSRKWFNKVEVKKALHVQEDITWEMCSDRVGQLYDNRQEGSYFLMPRLIESGLRILIFSGDTDGAVPYNGTQQWINNLKMGVVKPWRSWRISDIRISGYVTEYTGLTFITIRGAGHMVPQWKREESKYFFDKWMNKEEL